MCEWFMERNEIRANITAKGSDRDTLNTAHWTWRPAFACMRHALRTMCNDRKIALPYDGKLAPGHMSTRCNKTLLQFLASCEQCRPVAVPKQYVQIAVAKLFQRAHLHRTNYNVAIWPSYFMVHLHCHKLIVVVFDGYRATFASICLHLEIINYIVESESHLVRWKFWLILAS